MHPFMSRRFSGVTKYKKGVSCTADDPLILMARPPGLERANLKSGFARKEHKCLPLNGLLIKDYIEELFS